MKIVCPNCEAAYEVAAERLAPGQEARCGRCDTVWAPVAAVPDALPEPEPPDPPPEPEQPAAAPEVLAAVPELVPAEPVADPVPPQPAPEPGPEVAQAAAARRFSPALVAAWLLSLGAVAGVLWSVWAFRAEVAHAWPPSERLYGLFARTPDAAEPVRH